MKKIRVVCLNTADITEATSGMAEAVSEAQRLWFADTLLSAGNLGERLGQHFDNVQHPASVCDESGIGTYNI